MRDFIQMAGKHVLVTGGTSGIGRETAIILSELGARVCIIGRREEALKETLSMMSGEGHSMYPADLSKIEELEELIKGIVAEHGAFDGFVQSAGIAENLPLANFKYERLHKMMLTNFYSFFELVRVLCRKGRHNEGFSIVGVSSSSANCGTPAQAAYASSKAAMNGAMRSLARELGVKGIRVNSVLPGPTATPMYMGYQEMKLKMDDMNGGKTAVVSRNYLGMNDPIDVANAIVYLLSPVARRITGIELPVDGGYTSC